MLLHILIFACSSPTPEDVPENAHDSVLSGYQKADDAATTLARQAQDLKQQAGDQKGEDWTREEANGLLQELQNSRDALEASVREIESSLGNISRSLHTSPHSR